MHGNVKYSNYSRGKEICLEKQKLKRILYNFVNVILKDSMINTWPWTNIVLLQFKQVVKCDHK